jgi:hypothetical protein
VRIIIMAFALLAVGPAFAQAGAPAAPDIKTLRAGLVGAWQGKLEYRDYQSDRWFGLPVRVTQEMVGDGLTLIRKAEYDDGPQTGPVQITTVSLFDPAKSSETSATFRAGRTPELVTVGLRLSSITDATHWMMIEERTGTDDDRRAKIRETMTRDGARLTTLKEVDFLDDGAETWISRNRSTLDRRQTD